MNRALRKVLSFPDSHPAKRFVEAFEACRSRCVGRDIDWPERPAIDQHWVSEVDRREWKFSQWAYIYLSYTLNPREWLEEYNQPRLSASEEQFLQSLPHCLQLLDECSRAAAVQANHEIIEMVAMCREVFRLQQAAIEYRLRLATDSQA